MQKWFAWGKIIRFQGPFSFHHVLQLGRKIPKSNKKPAAPSGIQPQVPGAQAPLRSRHAPDNRAGSRRSCRCARARRRREEAPLRSAARGGGGPAPILSPTSAAPAPRFWSLEAWRRWAPYWPHGPRPRPTAWLPSHPSPASAPLPRPHTPPGPYPPANRCTSVSLWLILSPACPPGAEAGRGLGCSLRRAALVPEGNVQRPTDGEGMAEKRLRTATRAALPAHRRRRPLAFGVLLRSLARRGGGVSSQGPT